MVRNVKLKVRYSLIAVALLVLNGCETVGPTSGDIRTKAFESFTNSVAELQQGSDKILSALVEKSEDRFRQNLALEIRDKENELPETLLSLQDIQFTSDEGTFAVENVPYFLQIPVFKLAVFESNSALVGYANLLTQLADPSLLEPNKAKQRADDLNAGVKSAAQAINPEISPEGIGSLSVISNAAGQYMASYLEKRHKQDLFNVIEANQPNIEAFASHMQAGTKIIAHARQLEFEAERDKYMGVAANTDLKPDARIKAALQIVRLVKERIRIQETLLSLYDAYGKLPAAHSDLTRFKSDGSSNLSRIISLTETAKALKASYETSVGSAQQEQIQAEADRADDIATAAEIEASRLSVDVANLSLELARSKEELAENSNNPALKKKVDQIEESLATLQAALESKITNAKALRTAATAVAAATKKLTEIIE